MINAQTNETNDADFFTYPVTDLKIKLEVTLNTIAIGHNLHIPSTGTMQTTTKSIRVYNPRL